MRKFNTMIIDDEPLAIELLERYISRLDTLHLIDANTDAIDALKGLYEQDIQLLFLDIEMPRLTGMDLAKVLPAQVSVIFTTAYRHFALEAFEVQAVDYLLKPIRFERFAQAVNRYTSGVVRKEPTTNIVIRAERQDHFLQKEDIYYLEGLKDYTIFHTMQGKLLSRGSLGTFLMRDDLRFLKRIHRSFAINPLHLSAKSSKELVLNGVRLPIGRKYRGVL